MHTNAAELRRLRWDVGLNQKQVAEEVGLMRSTLCRLENGTRSGTPAQIKALADYYDVTVADLLTEVAA